MKLGRLAILVGLVAGLGACTDEQIVYVNRPFNPPVDAVNGFLGYFDEAAKQTSCGNCHATTQAQWVTTAHADAWASVESSANPSCKGCHTVSERGNAVDGAAGYNVVADASYHDVQCESCHGPGLDHASVPSAEAPLARLEADTSSLAGTCGDCHSGPTHPFVEEWAQSKHGTARAVKEAEEPCWNCHHAQGALNAWGISTNYVEFGAITEETALGITCAVCHDPHGSENTKQLRYPIDTRDRTQNLCMKCHWRRTEPLAMDSTRVDLSPSGANTPHGPQGAVVIAEAGYQPTAFIDDVLLAAATSATHGNLTKNPRLCAGCHVYPFRTANDVGDSVDVTGHLFRPLPCYVNGVPTDTLRNCAYTAVARSFKPCAATGCHANEDQAAGLLALARQRIQALSGELWVNKCTSSSCGSGGSSGIDTFDLGIIPAILRNTWDQKGTLTDLSLQADGAFPLGASVINLDAASGSGASRPLSGKLVAGNTLVIGGTEYTVTATVTADLNDKLIGVSISPPLAAALANNATVKVQYLAPLLATDRRITPLDGAEFNVRMVGEDSLGNFLAGTSQAGGDRSHTVHNPFLAEGLLRANIEELTFLYGSQPWFPSISPAVQQILSGSRVTLR